MLTRSGFKNRGKPLAPSTSTLKRSAIARGDTALTRSAMNRGEAQLARSDKPDEYKPKRKRSRGLKGRPPTVAEKAFMDAAGKIPCLACTIDGRTNTHISLHHIDGRTKPGAHFLVLPLCSFHHQQDDTDQLQRVSLHGRKETFTALYGTEAELLQALKNLIGGTYSTELYRTAG